MDQRHSIYFRYYKAHNWPVINAYILSAIGGLFLAYVVMR